MLPDYLLCIFPSHFFAKAGKTSVSPYWILLSFILMYEISKETAAVFSGGLVKCCQIRDWLLQDFTRHPKFMVAHLHILDALFLNVLLVLHLCTNIK